MLLTFLLMTVLLSFHASYLSTHAACHVYIFFLPFYSCRFSCLVMLLTFLLIPVILSSHASYLSTHADCPFFTCLSFLAMPFSLMHFAPFWNTSYPFLSSLLFSSACRLFYLVFRRLILTSFLEWISFFYHINSLSALASFPFIIRLIFSPPLNRIFSSAWSLVVKCQLSGGEGRGGRGEEGRRGGGGWGEPIKLSNSSKQIIPDQKK